MSKDQHVQAEIDLEVTLQDVMDELDAARDDRELIKEQMAEIIEKLTNISLERGLGDY